MVTHSVSKTDQTDGKSLGNTSNINSVIEKRKTSENSVDKISLSKNVLLDRKPFDNRSRKLSGYDDNANCTGVRSIENNLHAERDFADQKELSKQKTQVDISSTSTDNSLNRRNIAYVNEKIDVSLDTNLNTDDIKGTYERNSAIIENNNYVKYQNKERLSARGRSNTWTTSDSEEIIESELSPEEKDEVISSSSGDYISEEKDGLGRRRRLKKKRSTRSKTRPKIHLRNFPQSRSIDTSDGDILDSNYTSDDFSTPKSRDLSSAAESTICESDINNDDNENFVALTNKNTKFSTANDNTETQSIKINHNKKEFVTEPTLRESEETLLRENCIEAIYNDSDPIKSLSMTAITKQQQHILTSLSSSNMGGSRSEDESSRLVLQKSKDERFGSSLSSISKVSTKVISSFNPVFNSPLSKKRTQSAGHQPYHSASYSEIPNNHNNNSIKANPFSLPVDRHSDSEHERMYNHTRPERMTNSQKLEDLKQGFPLKNPIHMIKKPLDNAPDEESKKTAEVLNSLPNNPFYLSERFTWDTLMMQSKSTGSLGKMTKDIDIGDLPFSMQKSEAHINNIDIQQDNNEEFIAPPDNFKDNVSNSKHFKPHPPPLNMNKLMELDKDINNAPLNETNEIDDIRFLEGKNSLRRSSYLKAREDAEENSDVFIPKVPPPPTPDNENADVRVIKRPGLPKLSTTILKTDSMTPQTNDSERIFSGDVQPISPAEATPPDDSEEDVDPDFKNKVEKINNRPSRPRLLAQAPQLYGIPEVPLKGKRESNETARNKRKAQKYGFPEDTILEEVPTESPKPDLDADNISQGSLRSTPRDLSMEDLSSDTEAINKDNNTPDSPRKKVEQEWRESSSSSSTAVVTSIHESTSASDLVSISSSSANLLYEKSRTASAASTEELVNEGFSIPVINTPDIDLKPKQQTGKVKTPKPEMRRHVLQNLVDTEKSYVTNLEAMLTMFYNPLKHPDNIHIIEPSLVDEIFFQIPDILESHEHFWEELAVRVDEWSDEQIIGDIFVTSFTKHKLMDAYSNFINNFVQAKDAIRQASNRPQFTKYLEQCSKEHREKLTLNDLLIMPVQRIPRYVLILKDMLKYTPDRHPDYTYLKDALGEIKKLADKMNKGEVEANQAEKDIDKLRDIEQTIEGISDLVSNTRKFIRQDLVAEIKGTITKKDRCLFLFSNLLVCTTVRRKNHVLRRNSLFTGHSAAEFNRYKFLWKLALEDVEVTKVTNSQQNGGNKEVERLELDVKTLEEMIHLSDSISIPHQNLDTSLRELVMEIKALVQEKQIQSPQSTLSPLMSKIELQAQTDEGVENFTFIFLSAECKSSWEAYFNDARQKLAYSRDTFPPEFQYATPINKTRSGMQFTCAAPSYISALSDTSSAEDVINGDVWVCNSDGYVGQVCLLSMTPDVQSKASLSVCSARIVCIAVVPGARLISDKNGGNIDILKMTSMTDTSNRMKPIKSVPSDMSDDDDTYETGAENIIAFDSDFDEDEPMPNHNNMGSMPAHNGNPFNSGRLSPDSSSLGATESMDGDRGSSEDDYSSDEDERDSSQLPNDKFDFDNDLDVRSCMWLGTEDGHIYIYNAQDAITQRKSKARLQMSSPVTSLLYFENKVFVALGGGELCIYKRDMATGAWDLAMSETIHVSITGSKISCMTAVAGRIWCGCDNTIVLVNASSLRLEPTISVSDDSNKIVNKIVSYGLGVWVSLQGSATVRLYHATTYENLLDIDVSQAVQKMLAGADAIIRQHKAACLRVTSLLICKDLLWIGTSAGVILTNPLPSITASTSVLKTIGPSGSPHGHTGHVRFLTSVEVPKGMFRFVDNEHKDNVGISPSPSINRLKRKDLEKFRDSVVDGIGGTETLVVSGGDGYEDFRNNQQNEAVGRDDSTNHLLIWRV